MRHPTLEEHIKTLVKYKKHLDNFVKESRALKYKLEQTLERVENLIKNDDIGHQLKIEVMETLNTINIDIEIHINEKRTVEEKISTLLTA